MQVKPTIGSVVGKADDNHWGQILTTPQAYGLVEVEDASGLARQHGVASLTKLSDLLLNTPKSLAEATSVADAVFGDGLVTLILIVPVGKVIYLVLRGKGAVFLKRQDKLAKLLGGDGELSGEVQEEDVLLLVSKSFVEALSENELSLVFDHLTATEAAEKLTLLLHEASGGLGGAGLIFQIQKLVPVEEEVLPVQSAVAQPDIGPIRRENRGVRVLRQVLSHRKVTKIYHGLRRLPVLEGRKKLTALIAGILILLFIGSVFVGISRNFTSKSDTEAGKTLVEAERIYEEGVALLDLNPLKGRQRLVEAKDMLTPLATSTALGHQMESGIKSLYKQVNDSLSLAAQVNKGDPQLFYDVSLLKKNAVASAFSLESGIMVILDHAGKSVFSLDLTSKNGAILAGGEALSGGTFISLHGDNVYVLTEQGISKVSIADKISAPTNIVKDAKWGTIGGLVSFGGNIYLLDTGKSRIWKYVATDIGFSDLKEYLNVDTLPDLTHTTGIAIDSSVWLGTSDGKILKFTQGQGATYVPQGVDPGFGLNLFVYTDADDNNLYVLDSNNKRVVVLGKDGTYVAQYEWSGNFRPSQMVVSEKLKKIFLLITGKIYSLDLK